MVSIQEARGLLKKNAEHNRKVEQTLAKMRTAWQADLKQAPEEPETPVPEHNRKVEQTLVNIMAVLQADLKQAPEEPETPVPVAKNLGQGMNFNLNEFSNDRPSYKKLILYRSPNDYVRIKTFFKKATGISLQVKW